MYLLNDRVECQAFGALAVRHVPGAVAVLLAVVVDAAVAKGILVVTGRLANVVGRV